MNTDNLPHFVEETLSGLTEKLDNQYYSQLERLLQGAEEYARRLEETDVHNTFPQYIDACRKLFYELSAFLQHRQYILVPYIRELVEKHAQGHDCSTCAGACNAGHATRISEIQASHIRMKELLYNIDELTLQCNNPPVACPVEYSILKTEMVLINTSLSELFYAEEMHLLKKILEEQQSIRIRE